MRIATAGFAAEHYLPKALATLRKQLAECSLETRVCCGGDRIVGVANWTYDLGIVTHDEEQVRRILAESGFHEGCVTQVPLGRHSLCVLARRKTPAGRELEKFSVNRPVTAEMLVNWELVGPDRDSGVRRQLERLVAPSSLCFVAEGGGWSTAKSYVRAGLGVAIVPLATVTASDRRRFNCRTLPEQLAVSERLLHRDKDLSPLLTAIVEAIVAVSASGIRSP